MPVKLHEDGNQRVHDSTFQDGARTRVICVEKHGLEYPPSPHHEFVIFLGVGPELLKSWFFTLKFLLQAKQPAHPTKGTPCPMLTKHQYVISKL